MTEPSAPTSPSTPTTPAATPPVAPSAPVAPGAAAAPARQEWLPETYWDPQAGTIKPEFGAHYAEVAAFHKAQTETQAALAARKPEDIKFEVKLPETVKVPDGMDLKINENDPRVPVIREMAIKRGWDQDTVNELVALDAQQQIAAHAAEQTRIAAEDQKLGANSKDRKAAVGNWLKGMKDRNEFSPDEYEAVRVYAVDAAAVTALEKIIAKAAGSVPGHQPGNPPPSQPKTVAERMYPQYASSKVS
ncbi:hypothetical protein IVB03_39495 [Bradyrhizobium sp. 168]|uniref:hypothetical protein n=1 Tax=Bradyrhizobium sp. 168 TaxID=2782639 RepID=UPI001FF83A38|nr:hypothetical protein [Bradyrhizobium sp. 168]MCK1585481.1 hypothetical protein [Bradyrhizobium sp. 168]